MLFCIITIASNLEKRVEPTLTAERSSIIDFLQVSLPSTLFASGHMLERQTFYCPGCQTHVFMTQGCRFSGNTAPNAPALCTRLSSTEVAADNIALDPTDIQYMDH